MLFSTSCINNEKVSNIKKYKFGASYMTFNNPFFVELNNGIKDVVEKNGGKLITLDPQLDIQKQIQQIKELVYERVDVIFLNPVDWKEIKPALEIAKRANIPVIVVDAPVYDDELVECTVVSDNYNAGVLCAKDMIKRLNGKGNVVILEHPSVKSAIDRIEAYENTIKEYPDIKIVGRRASDGQIEKAMPAMESLLKMNKQIDAVMCLNDPTAMGAIAALEKAGRLKNVLVYGVDGSQNAKKMIKQGKMIATAAQFPKEIGKIAAEAALRKLAGEKIEHEIKVPVILIDKNNVDKY
ncbi:sugar ABC transporter substrate-binding protein [Caloramator sp. E03]|nr:sugar ABC transporter substrate-binding protein [Caloramator sp. E03]